MKQSSNGRKRDFDFKTEMIIDLQIITLSLIVKEAISNELALSTLLEFDAYHKEMEFYAEIAPKFNKKLQQLVELELFAEAFGVCKQRNILILEDLSEKGYKSRPAALGLNLAETKAVLRRIATFHAVCAVLQEEQPNIFENFKYGEHHTIVDSKTKSSKLDLFLN